MIMKYKLANRLAKRLKRTESPDSLRSPSSWKQQQQEQPKRVSICSVSENYEQEDTSSMASSNEDLRFSTTSPITINIDDCWKQQACSSSSDGSFLFASIFSDMQLSVIPASPPTVILDHDHVEDHQHDSPGSQQQQGRRSTPQTVLFCPSRPAGGTVSRPSSIATTSPSVEEEAASVLLGMKSSNNHNGNKNKKKRPRVSVKKFEDKDDEDIPSTPVKKRRRKAASKKSRSATNNAIKNKKCVPASPLTAAPAAAVSFESPPFKTADNKNIREGIRLAMPDDPRQLNSLHCFVRSELLEVFCLDQETPRRVGFRCVHCGHLPRKDRSGTSMGTFFPKSLEDIYRGVCTWQRIHFRSCSYIPQEVSDKYDYLKDADRSRGKKPHWVKSAYRMGLRDADNKRGGIIWNPDDGAGEVDLII
jgi:hypothetical protein